MSNPGDTVKAMEWELRYRSKYGQDAQFREADHPRRDDGKFGSGGGAARISPTERAWLSSYSGDDFLRLNKELREGGSGGEAAKKLDGAIAKSTVPTGTKLYRGLSKEALKSLIGGDTLKIGQVISDKAFLSTSADPFIATVLGGAMLTMEIPEGQSALNMSEISSNKHEKEVLLPRGSRLKIEGIRAPKNVGDPIMIRVSFVGEGLA